MCKMRCIVTDDGKLITKNLNHTHPPKWDKTDFGSNRETLAI